MKKTGADDYLVSEGPDAFQKVCEDAEKKPPFDGPLADRLVDAAIDEIEELFHDEFQEPFARIKNKGHFEIHALKSRAFKRWLAKVGYAKLKKAVPTETIRTALAVLEGKAVHEGDEFKLYNRIALHDGAIWYDLSDSSGKVVRVKPGSWEIVEAPILFRRYSHQGPQVTPERGGRLELLRPFVNLKKPEDWILLVVFLVAALVPEIPHAILLIWGNQGAAKSFLFQLLKMLIDPSQLKTLSPPKTRADAIQLFQHHWFIPVDNVSSLSDELSDAMCRAVTGDGDSKRALYTDEDDVIFSYMRVLALNGINVVLTKPDALDRALILELGRISGDARKAYKALIADFEKCRAQILGAMFEALSKAMVFYPEVNLKKLPRMADYAEWGCAIAEALGYNTDDFLKAYDANIRKQHDEVVQGNPIALSIVRFMANQEEWSGTPTELFGELERVAQSAKINTSDKKLWPQAPNSLAKKIKVFQHNLQEVGIEVTDDRCSSERKIIIRKIAPPKPDDDSNDGKLQGAVARETLPLQSDDGDDSNDGKIPATDEEVEFVEEVF